jgi:hypothetical protein
MLASFANQEGKGKHDADRFGIPHESNFNAAGISPPHPEERATARVSKDGAAT